MHGDRIARTVHHLDRYVIDASVDHELGETLRQHGFLLWTSLILQRSNADATAHAIENKAF
jgi:hypothetical protein